MKWQCSRISRTPGSTPSLLSGRNRQCRLPAIPRISYSATRHIYINVFTHSLNNNLLLHSTVLTGYEPGDVLKPKNTPSNKTTSSTKLLQRANQIINLLIDDVL